MPRQRNLIPSYILHKKTGRARAACTDGLGQRHEKLLPGKFGSKESKEAFARLQLELSVRPIYAAADEGFGLAELFLAFHEWAKGYYGANSKEVENLSRSIKPARELYGLTPAAEFGPRRLAVVREAMVKARWCRQLINRRIGLLIRVFKWGASEELIPASVYQSVRTLPGLRAGKTEAREAKPVKPVADDVVKATLPVLPPHVRALVEILWHTGARPSEICSMTLSQLDRTATVWIYREHDIALLGAVRRAVGPHRNRVDLSPHEAQDKTPRQGPHHPIRPEGASRSRTSSRRAFPRTR